MRISDWSSDVCSSDLTDAQLREITDVICRIEKLYNAPIDIEWAYAEGTLHLLQARPITTYVPLPVEMVTRAGERRRLYADAALRSEEHTSELPSLMRISYAVFCLKKQTKNVKMN